MKLSQRNQGAVALARKGKAQEEIAARVGVSQSLVSYWLSGQRVPTPTNRLVLERIYKISRDLWDERIVSAKKTARRPTPAVDATPPPATAAATHGEVDVSVRARAAELARDIDELRNEIRRDPDADADEASEYSPLERAKVLASCAATLKLLGTMTGETLEISESRILRLPAWNRIQDAIVRALAPFGKDVLVAVGAELQRLGGGQVE